MRLARLLPILLVLSACGDDDGRPSLDAGGFDAATPDAGSALDAGDLVDAGEIDAAETVDAGETDAGESVDAGETDAGQTDAGGGVDPGADAGVTRSNLPLFDWCGPERVAPGLYRGTLSGQTNDSSAACSVSALGGEASLRVNVPSGAALRAVYRHAADGVLYLLDRCGAAISCLVGADSTSSGAETVTWTNTSGADNEVFLILDSTELFGAQTFELDLFVE